MCWSRNCRLSAWMVDLVILSQSRNCLLSASLTYIISLLSQSMLESELSAVGRSYTYICAYYPKVYWSLNCRLSSCTASYISESELSAIGLNSRLSPTMHQTIESEYVCVCAYYPKVCWSRNCRLSAWMVDLVILSQSRNCLLSACTASYISESELSAVG